jgi:hypothetical protein
MNPRDLALSQARGRIAVGAALVLIPGLARLWIGPDARRPAVKLLARALGVRDLALGAAGLLALRDGDSTWTQRAFAAQAVADAVDLAALVAAGSALPPMKRISGGLLAAGSAAVAAAYAARLPRARGD